MEPPASSPRGIAFFDFDGTLATRDSLWPFLVRLCGPLSASLALGQALLRAPFAQDRRSAVKERLLVSLLAGKRLEDLALALSSLRKWVVWIDPTVAALKEHHEKGHRVVIASGSLGLYLPTLLRGLPYDDLLCTEIGAEEGCLTGVMTEGNCVRLRKAERVKAYLEANGPFDEIWGYGNAPHDLPMLALCDHKVLV